MTDEKILYHKKGKHWEITLSKTSKREKIEGVIGLLVLIAIIAYFLMK
ncbi:hypothetical protein [Streptococcus gallolyticus]|uniref:Uncharacterized protein n=1 Tax=Streptococcus gallolyticus TaxID=315405 RepID=A0A139QWR9_9STRE|nr:hypothetical protein [Streptococcus gallolyticus]KXT72103.1 hypothetical protein SGADD02_00600 [Streptococcus gallolyticus]KXU06956.1 hypothetical protein SGADD03_01269 [Streptococcus gallolyticus]